MLVRRRDVHPSVVVGDREIRVTDAALRAIRQANQEDARRAVAGPLMEFVPFAFPAPVKHPTSGRVGPVFAPVHLKPVVDVLDTLGDNRYLRFAFSVPPQTGKTTLVQAAIARVIIRDPTARVGYGSYTQARAGKISQGIRDIVERAGVETTGGVYDWRTREGGGVKAGGVDHGFTGNPYEVVVIDDPYDGRKDAESETHRAAVEDWFRSTLDVRCRAIVLVHTRWVSDDAIGVRAKDRGWSVINLPAVCEAPDAENDNDQWRDALGRAPGEPLCPELWPVAELAKQQLNAYEWASLFQGRPVPRGNELFATPATYCQHAETCSGASERLPAAGLQLATREVVRLRHALGLDCAFSESSRADYNVLIGLTRADWYAPEPPGSELRAHHPGADLGERRPTRSRWFVRFVWRAQMRSLDFIDEAKRLIKAGWQGVPVFIYLGPTDMAVKEHADRHRFPIRVLPTKGRDKFLRGQNTATAWNQGLVLVPEEAGWLQEFVDEVRGFTGSGQGHDDQVDGLVAAYDALSFPRDQASTFGQRLVDPYGTPTHDAEGTPVGGVLTGGANGAVYPSDRDAGDHASYSDQFARSRAF